MNLHLEKYANENGKLSAVHELYGNKAPEMTELKNLENASSKSLFSIVHTILDDNIEKKKDDIPKKVAYLLKKLVLEIGQRTSREAKEFKKQNDLCKSREKKYQSTIKVLEALATGASEEHEVVMNQLRQIKSEKVKVEEKKKKLEDEDLVRLKKEKNECDLENLNLKHELEVVKDTYMKQHTQLETQAMEIKVELEKKIMELENCLIDSRKKVKELERFKESRVLRWKKKERGYKSFIDFQSGSLKELLAGCESIKQEVLKTRQIYSTEINHFGIKIHGLVDAAQSYHTVLAENRRLYNEVQDLKGNIRVYCRIRPFLKGQNKKQTTIEYMGENGELVVTNPYKQGKDGHRLFKFNKVFGPTSTQEEVFLDTQPLIRSVLDGYNVCIFAYGQTGSGKTYTMTGPNVSCKEDWGVNYRALNDLFQLSQTRKISFMYEIGVQMVEIYNEQVRDLLTSESTQKRLGIWNSTQPNGLAVPDASMHPVTSTADVLELMNIGLMNRAVGATALNERSSRSHSVLTVHVRGTDLETNGVLRGNLHLVDLAGSERVDRSEATGDRLREAQYINKSLSALGDVIFALAQKSLHVPYRNSKLTQVLQSSLGGQAKTLMFVQLNPDVESFSETVSTLKFAERVSGVELGAARSNKEGRGVRELMEQMTSLKDTMAKKDEEIERLRLLKTNTNVENHIMGSPTRHSITGFRHNNKSLEPSQNDPSDEHVDGGQSLTINEDIEMLGVREGDSDDRLSDISDGVLSMGTETDGPLSDTVEFTLFTDYAKAPVENQDKLSVATKIPRPPQKTSSLQRQGRTTPARASLTNGFSRIFSGASTKKSTSSSSSSLKSCKR